MTAQAARAGRESEADIAAAERCHEPPARATLWVARIGGVRTDLRALGAAHQPRASDSSSIRSSGAGPAESSRTLKNWFKHGTQFGSIWANIWVTLKEAVLGFLFGVVAGVIVGIALGQSRFLSDVLNPYIKVLNAIPRIVLARAVHRRASASARPRRS